jgi:mono/diheme cytochrome c family protein
MARGNPTDQTRPSRWRGPVAGVLGAGLILLMVGGGLYLLWLRRAESTPALRGQAVALKQGCFACHGADGRGGVADPGSRNGFVPGWDGPTVATLAANEDEIREWILDGQPARLRQIASVNTAAGLVPMPAYRDRISARELADFMSYFRAVSAFGVEMPEPAYEGRKVADRLGCFGCHGPGGIGGSPNPGSFKGTVPAWDGADFTELVRSDAELMEWILEGHPQRLWNNPAARLFLERQIVGMPAYRRQLSADDQARLLAYFQWLRNQTGAQAKSDDSHHIIGLLLPSEVAP